MVLLMKGNVPFYLSNSELRIKSHQLRKSCPQISSLMADFGGRRGGRPLELCIYSILPFLNIC